MAGTFLLDTHLMVKGYLGSYGGSSVIRVHPTTHAPSAQRRKIIRGSD